MERFPTSPLDARRAVSLGARMARWGRRGVKLAASLANPGFRRGVPLGVFPTLESRALLRSLDLAEIYDVGANRGQFSLLARTLFPRVRIHAFEPGEGAADTFERLFFDDPLVRLSRVALAEAGGRRPFHRSRADDNSSLLPITRRQERYAPHTGLEAMDEVTVERLDRMVTAEAITGPALLKLDVQGGELAVLRGAEGVLDRFAYVLVEVSFEPFYGGQPLAGEVVAALAGYGFTLAGIGQTCRDHGRCVQADLLFRQGEAGRPRIKVLNAVHRAHFGGAQWRLVEVGEALRPHGVDTTVLFPSDDHDVDFEAFLARRAFPQRRLVLSPLRRRLGAAMKFVLDLPFQAWRVQHLIGAEAFDLLHVNGITNLGPVLGGLWAGVPVVWHWNDTLVPDAFVALARPLLRHPGISLVVASRAVSRRYGLGARVRMVLPPPIPARGPSGEPAVALPPGRPVIGFVSNLVEPKGGLDFVAAIKALRAEGVPAQGVMVGKVLPGHEAFAARLDAAIAEAGLGSHIHLVGYRTDVPDWLERFDALLFPSHTEAAPIVVLQALAAGLPLVATDVGNVREVTEGLGVAVVAVGDVAAMVAGLRRCLDCPPEERRRWAERVRTHAAAHHSIEAAVARHLALYRHVLDGAEIPPEMTP